MRTGFRILRLPVMFGHAMSAMYRKTKDERRTRLRPYVTEEEEGKYTGGTCTKFGMHIAKEGKRMF